MLLLLVGFALVDRSVVEENVVVGRDLGSLDGHGADSGGDVERVDSADGGVTMGLVVTVTLRPWGCTHVHTAGVPSGFDGVVIGPGA